MKLAKLALVALAASSLPATAHAADLKPAGSWAADYGDDYCLIGRVFGSGSDEVTLAMERTQPGQFFRLIVIGDAVKTFRGAETLGYNLGGGGERQAFVTRGKTGEGKQYLDLGPATVETIAMPAPGAMPVFKPYKQDEERAAAKPLTKIALTKGVTEPVVLETGSLEAPIRALQNCVNDLVTSWGLDAKAHQSLTRIAMPAGPVFEWVPSGTVPFTEFSKLVGGVNAIRVMVGADGKPTKCVVDRARLGEGINKTLCDSLMTKGNFMPALDAAGQPVASYWITEVFGLMPPMGGPRR